MSSTVTATRLRRWVTRAAFPLQASITTSFLAGSSLPTPLYPLYQSAWRFTPITVTVIFALYALSVLSALLVAGRLADHVGRRPVLIAATLAQVAAMAMFGSARHVEALGIARVIQGLATGAAVSAVGAALLDLHRERGTMANAIAPILGTALGGLVSGLMVHFLPAPLRLTYAVLGLVLAMQCAAVILLPESGTPRPGAWASLRPRLRVPPSARAALPFAVPVLVAVWAIAGFYASLGPSLVGQVFGADPSLYGGVALFILSVSGALAVFILSAAPTLRMLRVGAAGIFAGAVLILAAVRLSSAPVYLAGTIVTGIGFGAGFQGALRSIVGAVAVHERSAVLAVVYAICYTSMGLPSVLAGCAIVAGCSLRNAACVFVAVVMLLALASLAGARRTDRP